MLCGVWHGWIFPSLSVVSDDSTKFKRGVEVVNVVHNGCVSPLNWQKVHAVTGNTEQGPQAAFDGAGKLVAQVTSPLCVAMFS